jgi:diaminohydroxyphosphoribosylaminopyrimidine deaminase/5-amino-6-(5-phosphoribosylamino)uracil reductase
MKFTEDDRNFMAAALDCAQKAKGRTFPNPSVGAVIVKNGALVGKGATERGGVPHAEKIALKKAGNHSFGAVMYVTLEPCDHFGKSPPCTDAIIAAGIKKVIISVSDPNPLVAGRGIRKLRKNGIEVEQGLMREEAHALNEDFFWSITRKIPWVTMKLAMTLDGKIADCRGDSQWITSPASRIFVHDLRRRHCAIAVGGATIKKDDSKLTVRGALGADPVRIVFSSGASIPGMSYFMKNTLKTRSIIVAGGGNKGRMERCKNGIEIWFTGFRSLGKSLEVFLPMAYEQGITSIFVEGGQQLASSFLENRFVNRLYLFYGNKILGAGLDAFSFKKGRMLGKAIFLKEASTKVFGHDMMVTGIPVWQ